MGGAQMEEAGGATCDEGRGHGRRKGAKDLG